MSKNEPKNTAVSPQKDTMKYDPKSIALKWQSKWEEEDVYQPQLDSAKPQMSSKTTDAKAKKNGNLTGRESGDLASKRPVPGTPFFNLMMFPYPSAEGLHVGSIYTFGGVDVYGRFKRMMGYDVLEPIGLDGFGIHSENHAIKTNTHPIDHAKRTEENFYRQLHAIGNSYAWKNKVETYDPDYYRWTQWLFVQLFNSNLAYRKKSPVNFCPSCKTVLSDEQVIDGQCERCNSVVEKRDLEQWFFKITKYAEQLLRNIETLDWTDKVRTAQRNWIGKKEGINITYKVEGTDHSVTVFTTRPDTNFGATFLAIAPEHPLALELTTKEQRKAAEAYIKKAKMKSDIERQAEGKEKTGVFTGSYAINPLNGYKMPIWISDFVLVGFGTGALVGVPGHDKRDFQFAQKFGLEIIRVVKGTDGDQSPIMSIEQVQEEAGKMINSGFLNGMNIHDATHKIMDHIESQGYGKREKTYHLRDWLISRQRYWGPPIPMIYCEQCASVKPKVLVIHGLGGNGEENWFPWFKKEMTTRGYEVLNPKLPNADVPVLKDWLAALRKVGITKKDKLFVVAHSLGGPTATQFIKESGLQVEKLILVAPTGKEQNESNWKNLIDAGLDKDGVAAIKSFNDANTGLDQVKALVKESVLYLSDNDPYIPVAVEKTYKALRPKAVHFKGKGHFNHGAGVTEFAEILDEFPQEDELNLGWFPVPFDDLPVKLPYLKDFKPLGTGKSPLASDPSFYETTCPNCGKPARRETDVSDTFLDSAWYFLRYLATDLKHVPFPMDEDKAKAFKGATKAEITSAAKRKSWLPVTMYIGGAEHSVLHLLYARFMAMALKDMGYVDFDEPFARFYAHGLIIKDGAKMSKSKGNIINPDEYIGKYGADTLRTYLLFLGPFNQGGDFRDTGIEGMHRFVKRVWKLFTETTINDQESGLSQERLKMMHETIKGITEDMEHLRFNTAIAKLMIWYNFLAKQHELTKKEVATYLQLFAPFAPYLTEELWAFIGNPFSIHKSLWPEYDARYLVEDTLTVAVQVNGKLRGTVTIAAADKGKQDMVEAMAHKNADIAKFLQGTVRNVIYVPGKILNFVV